MARIDEKEIKKELRELTPVQRQEVWDSICRANLEIEEKRYPLQSCPFALEVT